MKINLQTLQSIELQDAKKVTPGRWGNFPTDKSFTPLEFIECEFLSAHDKIYVLLREPFLGYQQLILAGQKFAAPRIGVVEDYFKGKNEVVINAIMAKKQFFEGVMNMDDNIHAWKKCQELIDHMRNNRKPGQQDALNAIRAICWNAIGNFKWTHTKNEDWRVQPWPTLGWQIRDVAWAARRAVGDTPESELEQLNIIKEIIS